MLTIITSLQLMIIQIGHLYGITENSVLNDLNYFHVPNGWPPDLFSS